MRTLLRTTLIVAVSFFAFLPLGNAEEERVLHVYTWEEYFAPEVITAFEQQFNCVVEFDYYDSNETMFEMLMGEDGYDIITLSGNIAVAMRQNGWLAPLNHQLLPNLDNIDPTTSSLTQDPDMRFYVPYTETVTGIGYNRSMVPEDAIGSWAILGDSRFSGRMAMLNDMRETLGAGLKYLGYSLNTTNPREVEEAGEVVKLWKRNIDRFDVDSARISLAKGELAVIQAYSGDVALDAELNQEIGFFIPKEGSALNSDVFVIPADSPVQDLAHAFINHMLDSAMAALNMESVCYYMPNKQALQAIPASFRNNPAFTAPAASPANCEVIVNLDTMRAVYDRVWTDVLLSE